MDRNTYRIGWRKWTPRYPRQIGFRGKILLLCGAAWVSIGVGTFDDSITPGLLHEQFMPAWARSVVWVITGLLAIVYAWRPPGFSDATAWLALYTMPAIRTVSYTLAWLDSMFDFGGPGLERGWQFATIYAVMVGVVMICSDWPEPPVVPSHKEDG